MKRLIVYAGANGAGISSLRAGGGDPVDVEIAPDRIARQINPADPRSVDFAAGKEALRLFDRTLAEGRSLSLETTLTGRTVLGRVQTAKDADCEVALRYVTLPTGGDDDRRPVRAAGQIRHGPPAAAARGAPPDAVRSAGPGRHGRPGKPVASRIASQPEYRLLVGSGRSALNISAGVADVWYGHSNTCGDQVYVSSLARIVSTI